MRQPGPTALTVLLGTTMIFLACDSQESGERQDALHIQDIAIEYTRGEPAPIDDGNDLKSYVAQCEAVLGPIPEIQCDPNAAAPGTQVSRIPVFVDGHLLGFGDYTSALDDELMAEREQQGTYECDFPSVGGDFACTVGSTLVQYQSEDNPNVQWVGLCRGVGYDNPSYDRFIGSGLIGANTKTGEMCFFFGVNSDAEEPYELPRLSSDVESSDELAPWLAPRDMPGSCLSCHPNNDPWVMTPWLQPDYMHSILEREDYPLDLPDGLALEEVFAARFINQTPSSYKSMLPEPLPEGRTAWTEEEIFDDDGRLMRRQYRAVGSSYVDAEAKGEMKQRTGTRPESWDINFRERLLLQPAEESCANGCHAVANEHFEKLASDSLGSKYAERYLSPAMTDSAPGWAWMPPYQEGSVDGWLKKFSEGTPSIPAITECPIPKRLDDTTIEVYCSGETTLELEWTYENSFGDVPMRDDVRFDVAISTNDSPLGLNGIEGVKMFGDDQTKVLRDVERDDDGVYRVQLELDRLDAADELTFFVQPKRFCFEEPDRRPFSFAAPHRVSIAMSECR